MNAKGFEAKAVRIAREIAGGVEIIALPGMPFGSHMTDKYDEHHEWMVYREPAVFKALKCSETIVSFNNKMSTSALIVDPSWQEVWLDEEAAMKLNELNLGNGIRAGFRR